MTAEENGGSSLKLRKLDEIMTRFDDAYDALMEIGKIRALVVQQVMEEYRDRSLEEICREAFGARFDGTGPVDLFGEGRMYFGGEDRFRDNTRPCRLQDSLIAMNGLDNVQDLVHLWIFLGAPESLRNTIPELTYGRKATDGKDTDPAEEEFFPYLRVIDLRVYPKYIFLGDPEFVSPDAEPLKCMMDALFSRDVLEEKRLAFLRRCGLGLTGPEEERVRAATRDVQEAWERIAVWQERYGEED